MKSVGFIHKNVKLGNNVSLSPDTVLEKDVEVGNNVTFYPKVTIKMGVHIFDGAVIGRHPKPTANMTRKVNTEFKPLVIGKRSIVGANSVLYTGLKIGRNVLIGDLASIREDCTIHDDVVIGRGVMVMYETIIGKGTRIIDGAILTGKMLIQNDVFIGPGVNSINDNQPYLSRFGLAKHKLLGPIIQKFALVGAGANISAGIKIGIGSIVAPNAMVIHDVPKWTVVAGVPAQHKRNISPVERQLILKYHKQRSHKNNVLPIN